MWQPSKWSLHAQNKFVHLHLYTIDQSENVYVFKKLCWYMSKEPNNSPSSNIMIHLTIHIFLLCITKPLASKYNTRAIVGAMVRQVAASDCTSQTSSGVQLHSAITKLEGLETVEIMGAAVHTDPGLGIGFFRAIGKFEGHTHHSAFEPLFWSQMVL